MKFLWTISILSLFPITFWYFISLKEMSSLLESKYPDTWETLGKIGFVRNNSLTNSNKLIMFLLKREYQELNDANLDKTASLCRALLIVGTILAALAFIMPILIGKYG
ncbi:hypothetical protein [Shewanella baltica]|uniref:hypothetical protein n=1 Tax=Shewanella baltica TaxID=62322 RepID=UPI000E027D51|nr:hypothetical protein [Shewanella baltica]SUI78371.1 Uncharacterised protein [Shewanella baltica]